MVSRLPTYGICDQEVDVDLPVFIVDYPSDVTVKYELNVPARNHINYESESKSEFSDSGNCSLSEADIAMLLDDPEIEMTILEELLQALLNDE